MVRLSRIVVAMCIFALPGQAHEFWIEPDDYTVAAGDSVTAAFRNGERLVGSALSYIPDRSERFDMVVEGELREVPARIGDNPAFDVADLPEGLLVIVHETAAQKLTYRPKDGRSGWERFTAFTEHKAMAGAIEAHRNRGLPEEGIVEQYHRYAKALVAVGDGAGDDAPVGLRTEIVALANPYTDELAGGLPVRVLLDGEPRIDAQVELFARTPEGAVVVTTHRTDGEGVAILPVSPGCDYLADAVTLQPLDPAAEGDPVWQTLWAALTFAVPGR